MAARCRRQPRAGVLAADALQDMANYGYGNVGTDNVGLFNNGTLNSASTIWVTGISALAHSALTPTA